METIPQSSEQADILSSQIKDILIQNQLVSSSLQTENLYIGQAIHKNTTTFLQITSTSLNIKFHSKKHTPLSFNWPNILGAKLSQKGFNIYTYDFNKTLTTFQFQSPISPQWVRIIQSMSYFNRMPLQNQEIYRRKLYILLNPNSGTGKSLRIFQEINHILELCELTIVYTQYRNHATQLVTNLDLTKIDAIVAISGDGLIHQILNALNHRTDAKTSRFFPISVIPAGSANALSKIVCDKANLNLNKQNCAFIAAKGKITPMDITKYTLASKQQIFSFLSFAWAYIADVDIGSQACRCCGGLRFDCYGA